MRRFYTGTRREIVMFTFFGGVQLVSDWLTFVLLSAAGVDIASANLTGRVVGAGLGFWLNGRFTFQTRSRPASRRAGQVLRFAVGWAITATLSTVAVYLVERWLGLGAAWGAKLVIDACIAVLGFVLSKFWIFR